MKGFLKKCKKHLIDGGTQENLFAPNALPHTSLEDLVLDSKVCHWHWGLKLQQLVCGANTSNTETVVLNSLTIPSKSNSTKCHQANKGLTITAFVKWNMDQRWIMIMTCHGLVALSANAKHGCISAIIYVGGWLRCKSRLVLQETPPKKTTSTKTNCWENQPSNMG